MFICQSCFNVSEPNQACNLKVTQTRPREYIQTIMKGTEEKQYEKVYKFRGSEIVREQKTCQNCIDKELGIVRVDNRPKRISNEERKPFEPKTQLPYDILPTYFPWHLQNKSEVILGRVRK